MTKVLEFSTGANRVQPKKILEAHGFRSEFFVNEKTDPPVYHYVVLRPGSVEILAWGQERTAEAAESMARDCMRTLSHRTSTAV